MPDRPKRECGHPGCPTLVTTGRCAEHKRQSGRNHYGTTASSRGYDSQWQRVREVALQRDSYLCIACLRDGRVTTATDVDHIIPFKGLDDPLRLDLLNLQPLCRECHNIKTRRQG